MTGLKIKNQGIISHTQVNLFGNINMDCVITDK